MKFNKTYSLAAKEYIGESKTFLEDGLLTDYVYYKTLTGCGATHYALTTDWQVIVIAPNVPVIVGKAKDKKYKNLLGIHKPVTKGKIKDYLDNESITFKRIITTPESFMSKLLPVLNKRKAEGIEGSDPYKDFFLLFDESDTLITEIGYRESIAKPMNEFLKCERRAMISATPIFPSDPRFSTFKRALIKPNYEYKRALELQITNNVLASTKLYLESNVADHYALFVNSGKTIAALIKGLDIQSQSIVFCGNKAKESLDEYHIPSSTELKPLKKYNFFTSRFFAAVDIETDFKPNVVLITDPYFAPQTVLDPYTDVIQIAGRFRNGISKLTHLASIKPDLDTIESADLEEKNNTMLKVGRYIMRLWLGISSNRWAIHFKRFFEEEFKSTVVNLDFEAAISVIDYFKKDNEEQENKVTGYYKDATVLERAYLDTQYFTVTVPERQYFGLNDHDRLKRASKNLSQKERNELNAIILHKLDQPPMPGIFSIRPHDQKQIIQREDPAIVEAYETLGFEKLKELHFSNRKIHSAVQEAKRRRMINNPQLKDAIHLAFSIGFHSDKQIRRVLDPLYTAHGVIIRPAAAHIQNYFVADRTSRSGVNGYNIRVKID